MRDVIAVDHVVVPVASALFKLRALEAKAAFPSSRFGGVFGQRVLAFVIVPRADEVDGLAVGRGAEGEVELDRCHCGDVFVVFGLLVLKSIVFAME